MTDGALQVLEQGNLLGGADLVSVVRGGKGRKKRSRRLHVGAERRLGFATALALVVEYGRQKAKERGVTSLSRCPRCGHTGPTDQDFGTRVIRGERRPQSWCRTCRAEHLPALKAVGSTSGREVKAKVTEPHPEVVRRRERRREERSQAPEEGWLFPPEMLL
jgi:hypothetical protein